MHCSHQMSVSNTFHAWLCNLCIRYLHSLFSLVPTFKPFGGEGLFSVWREDSICAIIGTRRIFVNFGFVLRLQPLPLSFVAMFSQIFCFQPIVNNCRCITKLAHTSSKHLVSYNRPNFGSYGHLRPLRMSAILNVFR